MTHTLNKIIPNNASYEATLWELEVTRVALQAFGPQLDLNTIKSISQHGLLSIINDPRGSGSHAAVLQENSHKPLKQLQFRQDLRTLVTVAADLRTSVGATSLALPSSPPYPADHWQAINPSQDTRTHTTYSMSTFAIGIMPQRHESWCFQSFLCSFSCLRAANPLSCCVSHEEEGDLCISSKLAWQWLRHLSTCSWMGKANTTKAEKC